MKPNSKFSNKHKPFWAAVRSISQRVGYTVRGKGQIKVPTFDEIADSFKSLNLDDKKIISDTGTVSEIAIELMDYFKYRADVLNNFVEPRLMDKERAQKVFEELVNEYNSNCPVPLNKQKGDKKSVAYLTGIINIIIEKNISGHGFTCDYDPRELTTITTNGFPTRTLARRVDGAFPGPVNPIAVWEIKEYYYTTTFGSRVADGVYETLLDGMELEELHEHEGIKVLHYLMIDAHYTWWDCGRSYLCRIIDMLNMGYVDEVLFGYEIVEELPTIVKNWIAIARS
jgi:hypothetical protein